MLWYDKPIIELWLRCFTMMFYDWRFLVSIRDKLLSITRTVNEICSWVPATTGICADSMVRSINFGTLVLHIWMWIDRLGLWKHTPDYFNAPLCWIMKNPMSYHFKNYSFVHFWGGGKPPNVRFNSISGRLCYRRTFLVSR